MKKLLFLFSLMLFIGCKCPECPKCPVPEPPGQLPSNGRTTPQAECVKIGDRPASENEVGWLRDNSANLCLPELYEAALTTHKLSETDVLTDLGIPFRLTYYRMNSRTSDIINYEWYIGFIVNARNITDINRVQPFTTTYPLYSVPLLRAIAQRQDAGNLSTDFEFIFAKVNGIEKIVIRVKKNPSGFTYYDFSDHPKSIGKPHPIYSPL